MQYVNVYIHNLGRLWSHILSNIIMGLLSIVYIYNNYYQGGLVLERFFFISIVTSCILNTTKSKAFVQRIIKLWIRTNNKENIRNNTDRRRVVYFTIFQSIFLKLSSELNMNRHMPKQQRYGRVHKRRLFYRDRGRYTAQTKV